MKAVPLFTFNLDSFQITNTRSKHTDTVYATLTVKIGDTTPQTAFTKKSLGNLNNGTYNTGVTCPNVTIDPGIPVVVNYLIVNAGSASADAVTSALQSVSFKLADLTNLDMPPFASGLQMCASYFAADLAPIFKPGSCDGLVAAEQNTFTYEELGSYTSRTPYFTQATHHTGAKAGSGCNPSPSAYLVLWSMLHVAAVPNVINLPVGKPSEIGTAAQLLSAVPFEFTLKPGGANTDKLWVVSQSVAPGQTHSITDPLELMTTTTAR
jgi:hypothetical protein